MSSATAGLPSRGLPRTAPRRCITAAFAVAAALLVLTLPACGGDDAEGTAPAPTATPNHSPYQGGEITPAVQKPAGVFTDTGGQPFDLVKQTSGFITLVYVGYTHCPDVCPTHMYEIAQAMKTLPPETAARIKVVFATADPERDTPEALRTWLDHFDKTFIGITGTQEQMDALQEAMHLTIARKVDLGNGNYSVSHSAFVMAFTLDDLAHLAYPIGMGQETWEHDLPLLVTQGWKGTCSLKPQFALPSGPELLSRFSAARS